jgi:hypothetical protein
MTEFKLLESYYGERGYKQYGVYKDGQAYHLTKDTNDYLDDTINVNNETVTLENIFFSVEMYYYELLKKVCDQLSTKDFIAKFNMYQESMNELHKQLINLCKKNEELKKDISKKIFKLVTKDVGDIIYETSITNDNLDVYMIRIADILNIDINLENILLDLYEHELSLIDKNLFNITVDTTNEKLSFNETKTIQYLTNEDIINNMYISDALMDGIISVYTKSIYDYINIYDDYNEGSLKNLYECLGIKYVKLVIDNDNNKLKWIMRKLNLKTNVYIPYEYLPEKILPIVKNSKVTDDCIVIKYNTDDSDEIQMTTYLIDELYRNMHIAMLFK